MFTKNRIVAFMLCLVCAVLAGCGDSGTEPTAPPSGSFSNSSLNGTYVVSFSGYDTSNGYGSYFSMLGNITASGSGSLTAGNIDIDDPALGAALHTGYAFTHLQASGTYNVRADGRATGTICTSVNGTNVSFGIDFVLTSPTHGLISRFDNYGSGSGSIDQQSSGLTQASLAGTYAFGFSGVDSTAVNSLATVGAFTLDGNGNVTAGQQDFNDNGDSRGARALPMSGSVLIGAPGASQLATNAFGFGALHFDTWAIDPTHLKFIETDSTGYMEGDALSSTDHTSLPSGSLVFALSGEDTEEGPFASGGLLVSDGTSKITSGLQDMNDEGFLAQAPSVTGTFSTNGSRTVLNLNGIYNGSLSGSSPTAANYTFVAYPYNGGAFVLENDNGAGSTFGISVGNVYTQTATSITGSQGYGMNFSGVNPNGEVDTIAQLTASGTTMTGLYDTNNLGYLVTDASLGSGSYSFNSNGRGTASFPSLQTNGNAYIPALNMDLYALDSSTAVFLETDTSQLAIGILQMQTSAGGATPALSSPSSHPQLVITPKLAAHSAARSTHWRN